MKEAEHPKWRTPVIASREAPSEAFCPHCGTLVHLRQRKLMDGRIIFYWRHVDNAVRHCPDSRRPFG